MEKRKEVMEGGLKTEDNTKQQVCSMCGRPATQLVDGEPSCAAHIEQVYEHQVEDYTIKHLDDWRKA
jgi:hypothetical protein